MKKTAKRLFTAFTAIMIVSLMSVTVFAASLTKQQATDKALADAGLSSSRVTRLHAEYDDGSYEIEFTGKADGTRYEYEISKKTGRIKDVNREYVYKQSFSSRKIGKTKAYKIAAADSGKKLSVVKSGTCKLKKDDGEWVYKIRFKSGKYMYEYEILAPTGAITESGREYKG